MVTTTKQQKRTIEYKDCGMARSTFDEAEWYDKNSPTQFKDGLRLIKLADPQKGDKVLDFGCGTGNLTTRFSELVGPEGKVIGVDPDGERLALARKTYSASNLEYVQGSANEVPGGDYDIIFSNHAMHYCPDKNATLKTLASKMKKGGKLVYIVDVGDDVKKFVDSKPGLYGKKFRDAWAAKYHYTPKEDYLRFTTDNGFVVEHSEVIVCRYSFKDVEELIEFHKTHINVYDDAEFNREALKQTYGDDAFYDDYDYFLVQARCSH